MILREAGRPVRGLTMLGETRPVKRDQAIIVRDWLRPASR